MREGLIIRYITGRGGDALGGLSAHLGTLSENFDALAIDPSFLSADFPEQVEDVREFCAEDGAYIIANSYGAYLFLHSLIGRAPLQARALLLSPVLGRVNSEKRMLISRPPGEKRFKRAVSDGSFGLPTDTRIVTGEDDEVCDSHQAAYISSQLNIELEVLIGEGHMISPAKVALVVDAFLQT